MTLPVVVVAPPVSPAAQILGALERTFWTYVQTLLGLLAVREGTDNIFDVSTVRLAAIAAIPTALTFLIATLPQLTIANFWLDLTWRTVRTYVVAFAGFLIAIVPFQLSYSVLAAAGSAAAVAALAVIKGAIASRVGSAASAALLPARLDPASVLPVAA